MAGALRSPCSAMVVGVVCLVAFVMWERRHPAPLLDISAFRDRGLATGSVTLLIVFAVMFGIFLVLFPFFQAVLGWTALHSAAAMLPMTVVMMPMSTHRASDCQPASAGATRWRPASRSSPAVSPPWRCGRRSRAATCRCCPGLMLIGLGMGLTMTPATEAITETLPPEKQGVASALNDTSRELGGAVGIALLGSVLAAGYKSAIDPALAGVPAELAEQAREGIGAAFAVAAQAGDQGPVIIDAAKHAFVEGWVQSMWLGVGMAAVAFVYLVVRGPGRTVALAPVDELEAATVPVG